MNNAVFWQNKHTIPYNSSEPPTARFSTSVFCFCVERREENMAKRQNNITEPIQWYVWFIISFFIGALAGFLVTTAGYDYAQYTLGLLIFIPAVVLDILGLKALITEAHVKALEVFYGKERAIGSPYAEYDE